MFGVALLNYVLRGQLVDLGRPEFHLELRPDILRRARAAGARYNFDDKAPPEVPGGEPEPGRQERGAHRLGGENQVEGRARQLERQDRHPLISCYPPLLSKQSKSFPLAKDRNVILNLEILNSFINLEFFDKWSFNI